MADRRYFGEFNFRGFDIRLLIFRSTLTETSDLILESLTLRLATLVCRLLDRFRSNFVLAFSFAERFDFGLNLVAV